LFRQDLLAIQAVVYGHYPSVDSHSLRDFTAIGIRAAGEHGLIVLL
jgi:adenine deaminase